MTKKINLNVKHIDTLSTPLELKNQYPLHPEEQKFIAMNRNRIIEALTPGAPKLLLIAGPCSIHDTKAAKEYAEKLSILAKSVEDSFVVVMRVYFEKPRTTVGWKGLLYDPLLDGTHAINTGLRITRELLIDLASMKVPTAAEFLDPFSYYYFSDLISWGCIGARTSESQIHRQMASALPMPTAFKNNTTGNIEVAVNGIIAARHEHVFIGLNENGQASIVHSKGNPYGHLTLRGGEGKPNYDPLSIKQAIRLLERHKIPMGIIVDCSHDNSNKNYNEQSTVFKSILNQILDGEQRIRGMVLESHLCGGSQPMQDSPDLLRYAISLTDPCLDWDSTEKLVLYAHDLLNAFKVGNANK